MLSFEKKKKQFFLSLLYFFIWFYEAYVLMRIQFLNSEHSFYKLLCYLWTTGECVISQSLTFFFGGEENTIFMELKSMLCKFISFRWCLSLLAQSRYCNYSNQPRYASIFLYDNFQGKQVLWFVCYVLEVVLLILIWMGTVFFFQYYIELDHKYTKQLVFSSIFCSRPMEEDAPVCYF
jgi:hypothetical protein